MCSRFPRLSLLACLVITAGCEREARRYAETPAASAPVEAARLTPQQPGPIVPAVSVEAPYDENAYAVNEGKRLFSAFNCEGCHSLGGGGMGPPLMDDKWIYGSEPANIFSTIVEGRPNGMPSFGSKLPRYQIWQLVSFVRSMGGLLRTDVAPSRSDSMHAHAPEAMKP